jgi:hypothetical protein
MSQLRLKGHTITPTKNCKVRTKELHKIYLKVTSNISQLNQRIKPDKSENMKETMKAGPEGLHHKKYK